jgi:hypothetical protein
MQGIHIIGEGKGGKQLDGVSEGRIVGNVWLHSWR